MRAMGAKLANRKCPPSDEKEAMALLIGGSGSCATVSLQAYLGAVGAAVGGSEARHAAFPVSGKAHVAHEPPDQRAKASDGDVGGAVCGREEAVFRDGVRHLRIDQRSLRSSQEGRSR